MLDDDLENDATLGELEANVLTSGRDLAELGYSIKPLLWSNDYTPLTAILLLKQLDQHICSIIGEAFRSNCPNDVVLAKVFEVLRRIFGPLDPERVILSRLALVGDIAIEQL